MDQTLGHYKIVSELGRGGMGVVYKAYEESLNRYVAIKVLGEHLGHDESFVKRFVREARAAAGLSHPNVIQIFFIGHEATPATGLQPAGQRHYFVMEHVEGRSVHDLLETEGALDPLRAARLVRQAASGLAAAHDQGLVHRDIKPANLLVTKDERLKIADFGLALLPQDGATRLTATNALMGTPGYLSPEQCCGEPAGPRSDLYSLGMTFYEMLTGSMPFKGESPLAVLRQILDDEPPALLQVDPDLDPRIAKVVERMVAKEPNHRYPTCHELVADLDEVLGIGAVGQPTAGLARAAALPPQQPPPPPSSSSPTSTRAALARVSGRSEDAPTRVAAVVGATGAQSGAAAGAIGSGASAAASPSSSVAASAAPAGILHLAASGAAPAPVAPTVAQVVAAGAAAPSGNRRWMIIAAMVVMLVIAVSAGGLFLGLPLLIGDDAEDTAASSGDGIGGVAMSILGKLRGPEETEAPPSSDLAAAAGGSREERAGADGAAGGPAAGETAGSQGAGDASSGAPAFDAASDTASAGADALDRESAVQDVAPSVASGDRAGAPASRQVARTVVTQSAAAQAPPPARRVVVRESPRVSVIAVGEPLLGGAAEAALESQLSRHGLDLYDEGGILELRDAGGASSVAPSEIVGIAAGRGVDVVVLIEVEPLGQRELRALGRYSYATTSRVRVDAFLTADGDGIGRGWSEQVEYTEINAERQADGAIGRVSTEVAEAITAAWDRYRVSASR